MRQDKTTKKKMTTWLENIEQIGENIGDCLVVVRMMTMAGVRLPETLPWNEGGSSEIDMEAIAAEVVAELAAQNAEPVEAEGEEVPEEDQQV